MGARRGVDQRLRAYGLASAAVRHHHARETAIIVGQHIAHERAGEVRYACGEHGAVEDALHGEGSGALGKRGVGSGRTLHHDLRQQLAWIVRRLVRRNAHITRARFAVPCERAPFFLRVKRLHDNRCGPSSAVLAP